MLHTDLILQAARFLKEGQLISLPTETVYGLAANALDVIAVKKIFEVKGRPLIDPLIIHVFDLKQAEELAYFTKDAYRIAEAFWPGPLTIILKKKPIIPDLVTSGLGTVAIRIPKHPLFREVLKKAGIPLACPSANPFGYVSPTRAEHVEKTLGDKIAQVLSGGHCNIGLESTILYMAGEGSRHKIMRPGPISCGEIEKVLNGKISQHNASAQSKLSRNNDQVPQVAPGLLERHYSPHYAVSLFGHGSIPEFSNELLTTGSRIAIVYQKKPPKNLIYTSGNRDNFWLSEQGDLAEVARNLFDLMQVLDSEKYYIVFIEKAPHRGIGEAINDRLTRAAAK